MACSRTPKCSTRPYQSAVYSLVEIDGGPNDGTPLMVVLLLPARSAEPPHSSGSFGATALRTSPNAARVASPFEPGSQCGMSASQPSGSSWASSRSSSFLRSGSRSAQASKSRCHFSWASLPRATSLRVCSMTSSTHLERLVRVEAEDLLDGGDFIGAQRGAVRLAGVHLGRRRIADDGAHRDERRLVGDGLGRGDGFFDADDVLAALDNLHVPAVRLVAGGRVLGERDVGVVLDRDLVVVVEHDEVAQLLGARQRGGLAGDAFLHVAVGGDDVDVVVERAGARARRRDRTGRAHTATPSPSRPPRPGPGRAGRW